MTKGFKIEHWPLDRLLPYAANARTHSDDQVAQIAGSIAAFGFNVPCLVDERDVLIAGHGRLLAAQRLELETVPVLRFEHLSEAQARAFVIADNRIAENAGWDDGLLRLELEQLQDADFDLELTGFELDEIDGLLRQDDPAGNIDDDGALEVPDNPISKAGDLWLLGAHRLLCGDATVLADIERVLDGGLADLCFTDPPYNVDYGNNARDRMRGSKRRMIRNDYLGADFERFLDDACLNILTVTKGAAYICMSSAELPTLQRAFREARGHWSAHLIWAKNTFALGRADYQHQYESILYGWKEGSDHYWCGARDQDEVWFIDRPVRNDLHPTMKPVALVERAVRNSSKGRDVVLDPFAGSGTTLIAAEKTGRIARLVELDPGYCDVIVRRCQAWAGKTTTLDSGGGTFDEIAAARQAAA